MKTTIDPRHPVDESVRQIMQNRIEACRAALRDDDPHQAIHQARKQLKKIRALVRLVRNTIGADHYQAANAYFRDAARLISDARDATAILETIDHLQTTVDKQREQTLLKKVKRHLGGKKAAITRYSINQDHLLNQVLTALQDAESYYQDWSLPATTDFSAFSGGIKRIYKRGRKAQQKAYREQTAEAFHDWRKRVKYLRYQVKLLSPLWPAPLNVLEDELHQLTDYLGDDHDLFVLRQAIAQADLPNNQALHSLYATIETQRSTLEQAARPLSEKLYYEKPKRWVKTLAHYWEVSQRS